MNLKKKKLIYTHAHEVKNMATFDQNPKLMDLERLIHCRCHSSILANIKNLKIVYFLLFQKHGLLVGHSSTYHTSNPVHEHPRGRGFETRRCIQMAIKFRLFNKFQYKFTNFVKIIAPARLVTNRPAK